MGATISEKIIAKASGKRTVNPGDIVMVSPDIAVLMEYFFPQIIKEFEEIGVKRVWSPDKIVIVIDHRVPPSDVEFAEKHKSLRKFVKANKIKYFYDVGRGGISHQITAEKGHARPGIFYAADDTHATTLGALGCFATSFLVDMIEILATGQTWCMVPESIKVDVTGDFGKGVMGRDLMQWVLGDMGADGALYKAIEFTGSAIENMGIDGRMTICNLVVHAGAKAGIINPDKVTLSYVEQRAKEPFEIMKSDHDAEYVEVFDYDVTKLEPLVAAPHSPVNTKSVIEVEGIEVDQCFIGSCASGRMEDLIIAGRILKGRKISPETRLIIVPASQEIYLASIREGLIDIFIQAGAVVCPPNCAACPGGHMGILGEGEVCISSSTLNIKGRMGSPKAEVYLASPATIAASAVEGKITDPRNLL